MRSKRLAGIKNIDVYALALYVDPQAARSTLQDRFRDQPTEKLAADQRLFDGGGRGCVFVRSFSGASSSTCVSVYLVYHNGPSVPTHPADLVRADGVEKTLRLVVTSKLVNRSKFLDALADRLEPPLAAAGAGDRLAEFSALFDGADFRKGLVITFTADRGALVTRVDGREAGTIASRELTHTLFDIYLGPDPVSRDAKDAFGLGLAGMLLT